MAFRLCLGCQKPVNEQLKKYYAALEQAKTAAKETGEEYAVYRTTNGQWQYAPLQSVQGTGVEIFDIVSQHS